MPEIAQSAQALQFLRDSEPLEDGPIDQMLQEEYRQQQQQLSQEFKGLYPEAASSYVSALGRNLGIARVQVEQAAGPEYDRAA